MTRPELGKGPREMNEEEDKRKVGDPLVFEIFLFC